jgi:hypothetical protein
MPHILHKTFLPLTSPSVSTYLITFLHKNSF